MILVAVESKNITVDCVSATGELPIEKVEASFDSVHSKKIVKFVKISGY